MRRVKGYVFAVFLLLFMMWMFKVYAENTFTYIYGSIFIGLDNLPLRTDPMLLFCNNINPPKGILTDWKIDYDHDSTYENEENLFSFSSPYDGEYGNTIILNYDVNTVNYRFRHRCTIFKILNISSDEIWYNYNGKHYNLTFGYKFNDDYVVKYIILKAKYPMYIVIFADKWGFPFRGNDRYNIVNLFKYVNTTQTNTTMREICCGSRGSLQEPIKYNHLLVFLSQQGEKRLFYAKQCYSSAYPFNQIYVMADNPYRISRSNVWVVRFVLPIATNQYLDKGHTIVAKYIYYYGDTTFLHKLSRILSKENCEDENLNDKENNDEVTFSIHNGENLTLLHLPLYDKYSYLGLTFAHAFNLTYTTAHPKGVFYYLEHYSDISSSRGIYLSPETIYKLARKYNITIYSSCNDDESEILTASIAYHSKGIYIPEFNDADVYLCGDKAKEVYLRRFNATIYAISIIPQELKWKAISIIYANKSYPYIMKDLSDITPEKIKGLISWLLNAGVKDNPYFKQYGFSLILFGDKKDVPPLNGYDMLYGDINTQNKYLEIGVGRIPSPQFPHDKITLRRAVLMAEYDDPSYKAFLKKYDGMFTSLIFKKYLTRRNVSTVRFVERRSNIDKTEDEGKKVYEGLKKIAPMILSKGKVSVAGVFGLMYEIFSFTVDLTQIAHEIDWSRTNLTTILRHRVYWEPNLTSGSFYALRNADFFGYFGRIESMNFVYPNVEVHNLPLFKGLFYLDYANTYDIAEYLFNKGSFGIYFQGNERDVSYAQKRGAHFMRYLIEYKEPIGVALKDSANALFAEDEVLSSLGVKTPIDEIYGRAILGDPTAVVITPGHDINFKRVKVHSFDKDPNPSQNIRKSRSITASLSVNDMIHDRDYYIETSRNYSLVPRSSYLQISPTDVFIDSFSLPSIEHYFLTYKIWKEETNLTAKLDCKVYNQTVKDINGKTKLYVVIPYLCKENDKSFIVHNVSLEVDYVPKVDILNVTYYNMSFIVYIFSSKLRYENITIYDRDGKLVEKNRIKLNKGINKLRLRPRIISSSIYVFSVGNSTYSVDLSRIPILYVTEIYPNPPDENLEYFEIKYDGKEMKNVVIEIDENKKHKIMMNLTQGYYLFSRNKTLLLDNFDIDEQNVGRIIEIPNMRLNNNGERIIISYRNITLVNITYEPNNCVKKEICSINFKDGKVVYTYPSPLRGASNDKMNTSVNSDEQKYEIILLTNETFMQNPVKIRIKKRKCVLGKVYVMYQFNNNVPSKLSYEFLCSKTIKLIPPNGNNNLKLIISVYDDQDIITTKVFSIHRYNKSTLPCNLSIDLDSLVEYLQENDTLYYTITLQDRRCEGISHPVEINYGVEDANHNLIYSSTSLVNMECSKIINRRLTLSPTRVSKITHPLLKLFAKINDPYCNGSENISSSTKYLVYLGEIHKSRSEVGKNGKVKNTNEGSSSSSSTSSSYSSSSGASYSYHYMGGGSNYNRVGDIKIDSVILNRKGIFLLINNTRKSYISIYAYISKGKRLLSYYCNGTIIKKGWRASMRYTSSSRIIIPLCVKNVNDLLGSSIKVKYSYDNKTYKVVSLSLPAEYVEYMSHEENISQSENNKMNIANIRGENILHNSSLSMLNEYTYRCLFYDDKVFIEVTPIKPPINVTVSYDGRNVTHLLNSSRIFLLNRSSLLYVGDKLVKCSGDIEENNKGEFLIKRVINKVVHILKKIIFNLV